MWRIFKLYPKLFLRKLSPNKAVLIFSIFAFIFLPWYLILHETPPRSRTLEQYQITNFIPQQKLFEKKSEDILQSAKSNPTNSAIVTLAEFQQKQITDVTTKPTIKSTLDEDADKSLTEKIPEITDEKHSSTTNTPEGPGEMGEPYEVQKSKLSPEEREEYKAGWKRHQFNQYASDRISLHRSLKDFRHKLCRKQTYQSNLPDTTVIIIFHNEAWSTLLRTVHSVIDKSPAHLLKEIILVDDFSTFDHLKKPLEDYISQLGKVKILRTKQREGLIRARLLGSDHAQGKVLTFLDSHCECVHGWLEPLLSEIAANETTVVCPVIDVIDDETFEFHGANSLVYTGGFDWAVSFNWHAATPHEKRERKSIVGPLLSPTMAGGLFSISKWYFEHLGKYDEGMEIWGAENLEISFRIWMCGGKLEIIPCSHVGHIFRKASPYSWGSRGTSVLATNTNRLIEVWMDEYKLYYELMSGSRVSNLGKNIEERKEMRKRLQCKSFSWYLENIYPSQFDPGKMKIAGEIRSNFGKRIHCLDSGTKPGDSLSVYECHGLGGHQIWFFSPTGEIRKAQICLDYTEGKSPVKLNSCHGRQGNQEWEIKGKHIIHKPTKMCLTANINRSVVTMSICNADDPTMHWTFNNWQEKIKQGKLEI